LPLALWQQKPRPNIVFNPGHYCPLVFPAPLVVSIMDLGYLRYPGHFTRKIYWKLKFWTAVSIKRAKHLLTISQATKNDIIREYGLRPERITIAYPGYDQSKFKIENRETKIEKIKKKYKINGRYLLFLSTLKPSKNIEGLLEAFKLLKKKDLSLVIAGRKGWLFEKIFEKVKELALKDKVVFTDFVEEEDLASLMAGAEVFVLPSFWEGFGIPVLEAMAVGTPVVASRVGSLPEIVNGAGILVDPYKKESIANGIKEALNKKEELVKKGLEQSRQFNWLDCAEKVIKVLEKEGNKNV